MLTHPRWILLFIAATLISILGCGNSGSTANVQNPPPPPPAGPSIAFSSPGPPGSIQVASITTLTAVVSNDPSNAGVDWSLTCAVSGACGSFSPTAPDTTAHTASGSSVTYYPPSTLSGNSEIVNIAAYATADHTKNVLASITVTGFGNNFQAGNYVLQAQGVDANGGPNYQFAGVIHLDGRGGIAPITTGQPAGEQTINFWDGNLSALVSKADVITGGTYFLGPDGRGTIIINTADNDIGGNGIETFSFVYLNSSHALIAQLDLSGSGASTGISASGTMDLQDPTSITAAPSGSYAFVASGLQVTLPATSVLPSPSPVALGGILAIDSPNQISGIYSSMDNVLPNPSGTAPVITNAKQPSGSVSNPDAFGRVLFNLNVPFVHSSPSAIQFTGYVVDAIHIKLIESDNNDPTSPGYGSTAGQAIAQASADIGNFTVGSVGGTYVFGITGTDLSNGNITPNTFASAGMFYADGGGDLSNGNPGNGNFMDTILQANSYLGTSGTCNVSGASPVGAKISATFGGTYAIDVAGNGGAGIGRVKATLNAIAPAPLCGGFTSAPFLYYLTGDVTTGNCPLNTLDDGNCPVLVIALGNANYPYIGTGIAYPQSASPTFLTSSGISFTQYNGSSENDGTAEMVVGANSTPPSLSGVADNSFNGINLAFGGSYDLNGCFTTVADNLVAIPNCYPGIFSGGNSAFENAVDGQLTVDFFLIDGTLGNPGGFFVETDWLRQMESGVSSPQVTFGYFAAQCPINSVNTCPPPQTANKRNRTSLN